MSGSTPQPTYSPSLFNQYTIAFEGGSVACILYGVYIVIAGSNLTLLRKKKYSNLLAYSIVQLVITTLYFAFSLYAAPAQSLGIFKIVSSNGPNSLSPWPSIVVDTLFVLNTWASDAFLLYRCYVVCMGNMCASTFPALLYIATVGSSLAWLAVSSAPGAVYSTQAVQVTGICYWSCSVAMNVCASCIISARMLMHRRDISRPLGVQHGALYLSYMSMTLESALLYTVFVCIALVVFVLNSPLENVFFPVLGTIQAIAPALIIHRIASGVSFETQTHGNTTAGSMQFASFARDTRQSVHQDISEGSDTMQAFSGGSVKMGRDSSSSSFEGGKEEV